MRAGVAPRARSVPLPDDAVVAAEISEERLRLQGIRWPAENNRCLRRRSNDGNELAVLGEEPLHPVIRVGVQVAQTDPHHFGVERAEPLRHRGVRVLFETEPRR